jgi:hypothetical protein
MRLAPAVRAATLVRLAAVCGPPIGVHRMSATAVHRELTANELTVGEPSVPSHIVLERAGLEVPLDADTRALLREALFMEPLPFVRRLVFIATPQRGSYRATAWVSDLVARLVRGPGAGLMGSAGASGAKAVFSVKRVPTSIDNMSPSNPFVRRRRRSGRADVAALGHRQRQQCAAPQGTTASWPTRRAHQYRVGLIVHSSTRCSGSRRSSRRCGEYSAARLPPDATHDPCRPAAVSGERRRETRRPHRAVCDRRADRRGDDGTISATVYYALPGDFDRSRPYRSLPCSPSQRCPDGGGRSRIAIVFGLVVAWWLRIRRRTTAMAGGGIAPPPPSTASG